MVLLHCGASLAQLVERFTRNEKVASSILAGGSDLAPGNRGFFVPKGANGGVTVAITAAQLKVRPSTSRNDPNEARGW